MSTAATASDDTPPTGRFATAVALLRKLIDFGKELAAAFRQPEIPSPVIATTRFGADGIALILARIARGLLRAQLLQERLRHLAARPEPKSRPQHASAARSEPTRRPATPSPALTAPDLAHPATAESIALEDRRRPIGAILADICRDLGIIPRHPLWQELNLAIGRHRGNFVALFNNAMDRIFAGPVWQAAMRAMFPEPPASIEAATGPP